MSSTGLAVGPVKDTAVGDIVVVNVESEGPYGVSLEADEDGCAAVIKGFEKLPNGKFGPLQKHGGVHYGDVLFAINDMQLDIVSFPEVMSILRDRNLLRKALKFMSSGEYYHRKRKKANSLNMFAQDKKDNFLSIVRRARVVEEGKSAKFVQYEVACQFRVVSMKLQKEIVYKWSVWKRYTEFDKLNSSLKEKYGWRMNGIDFPSSHVFVLNKLAGDFIEMRREELNVFWQKVIRVDKITEFTKHHCSPELKDFLDVEMTMRSAASGGASSSSAGGDYDFLDAVSEGGTGGSSSTATRRQSQKPTARRRSTNNTTLFTDTDIPSSRAITSAPTSSAAPAARAPVAQAPPQTAPPERAPPPPPPPPKPSAAPAAAAPRPSPAAAAGEGGGGGGEANLPTKPTGGRANLLADIARRRIE
jgi:hypothetical protein